MATTPKTTINNDLNVLADNGNGPDDFGGDGSNNGAITLPSGSSTNGGVVSVNNNGTPNDPTDDSVIYSPANGFVGTDTFDYTITDANNDTWHQIQLMIKTNQNKIHILLVQMLDINHTLYNNKNMLDLHKAMDHVHMLEIIHLEK